MTSRFELNSALLAANHPHLPWVCAVTPSDELAVQTVSDELVTLLVKTTGGRMTLHSRFSPVQEAEALTAGLDIGPDEILVILGFGLGYHVAAAITRLPQDTPIMVVEASPDIFRTALEHANLTVILSRPKTELLVGLAVEEALSAITRRQIDNSFSKLRILVHPPSAHSRPEYYHGLEVGLKQAAATSLRDKLIKKRLATAELKILVINTGYFLNQEIYRALTLLGHQAVFFDLENTEYGAGDTISRLLAATADFKPDFVLTVNHLGLDAKGILINLLNRLKLPLASWFVDSPIFILRHAPNNVSDNCSIFVWDRDYLAPVKSLGYEHVHYLPLATDDTVFKPNVLSPNPLASLSCDLSFVGNSMSESVQQSAARLNLPADPPPWLDDLSRRFIKVPDRSPRSLIYGQPPPPSASLGSLTPHLENELEALITWRSTQIYRSEVLLKLADLMPTIVGDQGWSGLLGHGTFRLVPQLDYYRQLPMFYQVSKVNLNITSMQMKTGLNQRIFDVPACNAMVITDYRNQIDQAFEVGRELVCYTHPEEALDLARFYIRHDRERAEISARGRERVLARHTYRHRLRDLIEQMRQDHLQ